MSPSTTNSSSPLRKSSLRSWDKKEDPKQVELTRPALPAGSTGRAGGGGRGRGGAVGGAGAVYFERAGDRGDVDSAPTRRASGVTRGARQPRRRRDARAPGGQLPVREWGGGVLGVWAIAYCIAIFGSDGLIALLLGAYGPIVQLAPAVYAGLFWKKASTSGVILGLVGGVVVTIYFQYISSTSPYDLHPGLIGLVINIIIQKR